MRYLQELGFNEEIIEELNKNLPDLAKEMLEEQKDSVIKNINYLKDLGVSNYEDAFIKFYNMFLLNSDEFEDIFSKYDREDLVQKLEGNIAIMEYL